MINFLFLKKNIDNMKKITIILALLFLAVISINGQKLYKPNTLYAVVQPVDFGVGLRYDRMLNSHHGIYGVYGSLTYGSFKLETGEEIKNHFKFVSGVLLYLEPYNKDFSPYIGVGLSYNIYDGLYNIPSDFNPNALNQWSFELSCNARLSNKWNLGVRVDPIKWESSIDIGVSF